MNTIIEYLQNPMKVGVYNHKLVVDFSGFSDYLKTLVEKQKDLYENFKGERGRLPKSYFEEKLSKLREITKQLDRLPWQLEGFFKEVVRILMEFSAFEVVPRNLSDLLTEERIFHFLNGRTEKTRIRRRRPPVVFESHVIPEAKDVFSIEKSHVSDRKWLFDIVTIKEKGILPFKNFLQSISPIKKQLKTLKKRKHFSARYTFRPYHMATQLWLRDDASVSVPSDLKSFLQGAIRYFFSAEWRTSIVLSAISVESMLADLYEEQFKEPAPDKPLGELFREVKEKIDFPSEVLKAIDITNKARIAAVHRSRFPVSDKEATNALYGATNFTLWYSSRF